MATDRLIPRPPRAPTPPRDESSSQSSTGSLENYMLSPAKSSFDPKSLSPMDENFPSVKHASIPTFTTTLPLADQDPNSMQSPMSEMSSSQMSTTSKRNSLMVEDHNGVFNFQPGLMAKSPISKSVGSSPSVIRVDRLMRYRASEHWTTAWS